MNFFGIGTLELVVILAVAFVALGPGKTVEVARTIGKMTREARRTFADIMDAASLEERGGRTTENASRNPPPPSPPSDPIPSPPHLSAQSQDSPDDPPAAEPADPKPPDSR